MSTISKEKLRERAREKVKSLEFAVIQTAFADSRAELEEELELASIALASIEAEAVGFIARHKETGKFSSYLHPKEDWFKGSDYEVLSAYTAPPVPVSVPDLKGLDEFIFYLVSAMASEELSHNEKELFSIASKYISYARERFSSAMLQGAEPVTTDYKLPANTPCKDAPEHIWLQTAGVWPENGEFSELTWCSDNQHKDDTLYVRADVVSGNSPAIPDCSCGTCRPVTFTDSRFVVCSECGNKRCPHANDHRNACTGSNEPSQEGSAYPAAPQHEVKP